MAIHQMGRWFVSDLASLKGAKYDSDVRAFQAERHARQHSLDEDMEFGPLSKLSTEELKHALMAAQERQDTAANMESQAESMQAFLADNPDVNATAENGAALATWLRLKGLVPPYSREQLLAAREALRNSDVLETTGASAPAKPAHSDEELQNMPLAKLRQIIDGPGGSW
jgi:hypothetical protein